MSRPAAPLTTQTRRQVIEQVAPRYRQASFAQKILLLDTVVAATGYARKYAITLLNQASERTRPIQHAHLSRYSSEVQNALFEAWHMTNWICAKRLIPFLPTLVDALERHGHFHLTEESRTHLLQVSPATAERFLRAQRQPAPRGLSTTKAGTLLKHQIPIRTFEQWDETQPGFLEADLVAHCGGQSEGSYLYTFTLTDIATGWTECLPLLSRSSEAVQIALMRARMLFPFPILGLDTDNGKEFLNETILAYCEREHLTFTRGRPECKNDQCFIEQKNGAVVRQFVGNDRFVGEQAYRQLHELYRALRLYVNCFQPSMKLQSKDHDGQRVRRVYDPAKTPLQRLLLSGILSAEKQHELSEVFQALDPLDLFQQVEQLQQAFLHNAVSLFSSSLRTLAPILLRFSSDQCFRGPLPAQDPEIATPPPSEFHLQPDVLDWPRTTRDPFEGEWEQILACVLAHPEYSSGDIFQKLQQLSPERYHPSQLGTLQRGVRKIRAHLLHIMEEPRPHEVIQAGSFFDPSESKNDQREREADPPQEHVEGRLLPHQPLAEEAIRDTPASTIPVPNICTEPAGDDGSQTLPTLQESRGQPLSQGFLQVCFPPMTIERAIASYIQNQMGGGRSPKTMEWHQTALGLFQHYLVNKRHLLLPSQITEKELRGWVTFLRTTPTRAGTLRLTSTIATYARSARAFCNWLLRQGYLVRAPFAPGIIPKAGKRRIELIEPDEFERVLQACQPSGDLASSSDWATSRNRALLWVLLDTGIHVCQLCALQVRDVDREQGSVRIGGSSNERWITLSPDGREHLLSYLDLCRLKEPCLTRGCAQDDPLFLSERYLPLTTNATTLLFGRLRKRAGMTDTCISPSALRDTFAVRYLQKGGEPGALQELLDLKGVAAMKGYVRVSDQGIENTKQKEPAEDHLPRPIPDPQKSRRRRRSHLQQQGAGKPDGSARKEPVIRAEDDP